MEKKRSASSYGLRTKLKRARFVDEVDPTSLKEDTALEDIDDEQDVYNPNDDEEVDDDETEEEESDQEQLEQWDAGGSQEEVILVEGEDFDEQAGCIFGTPYILAKQHNGRWDQNSLQSF